MNTNEVINIYIQDLRPFCIRQSWEIDIPYKVINIYEKDELYSTSQAINIDEVEFLVSFIIPLSRGDERLYIYDSIVALNHYYDRYLRYCLHHLILKPKIEIDGLDALMDFIEKSCNNSFTLLVPTHESSVIEGLNKDTYLTGMGIPDYLKYFPTISEYQTFQFIKKDTLVELYEQIPEQ